MKKKTPNVHTQEAVSIELNRNTPEKLEHKETKNSFDKRFFIYAKKNCPRRSLDALKLQKHLIENNWQSVSNPRKANFIIIYTCGNSNHYEKRSILTVEKALENKSAKVIMSGCLPKITPAIQSKYKTVYLNSHEELMSNASIQANFSYTELNKYSIVQGIHDLYRGSLFKRLTPKKIMNFARYSVRKLRYRPQRQRSAQDVFFSRSTYRLEIGKGCLGDCSYCAIRIGMPKFKSHPEEHVMKEFQAGLKKNYKTFALMAGDIGCYGLDINTNLSSLLSKLFSVNGDYKILLWDFNVRWFVKNNLEMLSVLKTNFKKVERIIMPIQSGSNRILKLMNRHYEIEEVKNCILNLQKNIPEILLETHILVGFPGETDEDFNKSLDLIREIEFHDISIFPYEDRPGTASSKMLNKVPEDIIKRREKIIKEEINQQNKRRYN